MAFKEQSRIQAGAVRRLPISAMEERTSERVQKLPVPLSILGQAGTPRIFQRYLPSGPRHLDMAAHRRRTMVQFQAGLAWNFWSS